VLFSVGHFRRESLGRAPGRPNVMLTPPQAAGSIRPEVCEVPPNSDDRSMTSQILRRRAPQNDDAWRRETFQLKTARSSAPHRTRSASERHHRGLPEAASAVCSTAFEFAAAKPLQFRRIDAKG
jgi:hypothetical protein